MSFGLFAVQSNSAMNRTFQVLVGPVTKMVFVADAQEIDDVLLRSGSKHLDLRSVHPKNLRKLQQGINPNSQRFRNCDVQRSIA